PGSPLVTVTGHSLGGALSPALALFLSDIQGTWNLSAGTEIASLASAGPTPGNGDFAVYFNSQLGHATTRYRNILDVVPHVWHTADIAAIPGLDAPDIAPDLLVAALADTARAISLSGDYTQIVPVAGLPGNIDQSLIDPTAPSFENDVAQMHYQ